jgi:hypothetical protein
VHRLPRLQVNVDLSLRLLSARSAGHGDVKGRLTHLPHATFSRFKKAREVAHQNRVRDSYPHGRKNACSGYRHISSLPTDQDEVTAQVISPKRPASAMLSVVPMADILLNQDFLIWGIGPPVASLRDRGSLALSASRVGGLARIRLLPSTWTPSWVTLERPLDPE